MGSELLWVTAGSFFGVRESKHGRLKRGSQNRLWRIIVRDKLVCVQVVTNCLYSVGQMCTWKVYLAARILHAFLCDFVDSK